MTPNENPLEYLYGLKDKDIEDVDIKFAIDVVFFERARIEALIKEYYGYSNVDEVIEDLIKKINE